MSEYQRFVSYLYEYQDNEKSRNCGFSRVEVRNRQCKIEVHMKLPQLPFVPEFQVYAFVPSQDRLVGIRLGKASYHQGAVYGLFTIPQQQIKDQPYTLEDLGGLLIQTDGGQVFATAWKEMPIVPDRFILPEAAEPDPQVRAASLEDYQLPPVQDTPDAPEATEEPDTYRTTDGSEKPDSAERPDSSENPDIFEKSTASENPGTYGTPAVPENPDDYKRSDTSPLKDEPSGSVTQDSAEENPEGNNPTDEPSPEYDQRRSETPDTTDRWQKIQETYPHIEPFFDEEIHQCVQLTLKDLPDLGKYALYIGTNQFLTHGCQTYQHLLLGRFSEGDPNEYVLGVPGVYDEKERFLAAMFGFPNFKPARSKTIRPGQFGYWYRFIY